MVRCFLVLLSVLVLICCRNDNTEKSAPAPSSPGVAEELFNQVKKYPDSANLRMLLINALDSLKMFGKAISQTDSLIVRDSLNSDLWLTKAQLQAEAKDTAASLKSFTRAANIYPSASTQLNLANMLAEIKDHRSMAITANVRLLRQGKETDAYCDFIDGIYYARSGNRKSALQAFDKAILKNYTLMEAYMEKGFIYYEAKDYPAALQVFETAAAINGAYADAFYWQGKCYEASGNRSEAVLAYEKSLNLDSGLHEAAAAIRRLQQ